MYYVRASLIGDYAVSICIKWDVMLFTTFLSLVSGLLLFFLAVALVSLFAYSVWVYVCSCVVSVVFVDFLFFIIIIISMYGPSSLK